GSATFSKVASPPWSKFLPKRRLAPAGQRRIRPSQLRPPARLNCRRVDFKHHGNLPSTESLARACADVSTFFEKNTPLVFNIDYNAIDMADLIPQPTTRALAKQATTEEGAGNRAEAMGLLSDAFEDLFRQHDKTNSYRPSPFAFGPRISFPLRK